jgi:hypothetical protein
MTEILTRMGCRTSRCRKSLLLSLLGISPFKDARFSEARSSSRASPYSALVEIHNPYLQALICMYKKLAVIYQSLLFSEGKFVAQKEGLVLTSTASPFDSPSPRFKFTKCTRA